MMMKILCILTMCCTTSLAADSVGPFKRRTDYPPEITTIWEIPPEIVKSFINGYLRSNGEPVPTGKDIIFCGLRTVYMGPGSPYCEY